MKSIHFVRSFFIAGFVFAVAAMVSFPVPRAYAEPSDKGNPLEQLIENLPQSLRHLVRSAPKFIVEAHEAGKGDTQDSPPGDGLLAPPGSDEMVESISATAFHAISSAQECELWLGGLSAVFDDCPLIASVELPNGAQINKVEMSAIDDNGSKNIGLGLFRQSKDTRDIEQVAYLESNGMDPALRQFSTTTITNETVSYPIYSYFFLILLSPDQVVISVRIWYDPNTDLTVHSLTIK
jgi:hypothetical protein